VNRKTALLIVVAGLGLAACEGGPAQLPGDSESLAQTAQAAADVGGVVETAQAVGAEGAAETAQAAVEAGGLAETAQAAVETEGLAETAQAAVEAEGLAETAQAAAEVATQVAPTLAAAGFTADGLSDPALELASAWQEVYSLPEGVPFTVTATEAQVTAAILASMETSGYDESISNLWVTLDDGQVSLDFDVTLGAATVHATVVFEASVVDGELTLSLVSAEVAGRSLPTAMLDALNQSISQAVVGASGSTEAEVTLTGLEIDDGVMTVSGVVSQ
jgi:hypothetical protein